MARLDDDKTFILHRGKTCFAILNLYPYNNGHLMIVPYEHTANLADLSPDTAVELWDLTRTAVRALERGMRPNGLNIGMNLGHVAGAGVDDHLHMHVVPRWEGDTSFMGITGNTRLIPQDLSETWRLLRSVWAA
ncbi:MAG: HIT domain-containing protein [Chloroflexi bacterium]|nr:HIT domain-containing protein [Chloroflexota bacterium]